MIVPEVGVSSVPRTCSSVDLPTPDAPTTDAISPGVQVEIQAAQHLDAAGRRARNTLVRSRTLTAAPPADARRPRAQNQPSERSSWGAPK